MKSIIGTNTIGYPEIRNFAGLPFKGYEVQKKQSINKLYAHVYFKLKNKTHQYYWNTFNDLNFYNVSLFHFFNALSTGKTPWITTFETSIPRWGKNGNSLKGLKLIANKSCKKIIAISECTANIQRKFTNNNFPEFNEVIEEKMMVLHPPQKLFISDIEEKELDEENIHFILVGNQIFSKGGREVISVLAEYFKKGFPIKLNLVSSLRYDKYATFTTSEDVAQVKTIIDANKGFINHYSNIPNHQVMSLMKQSHVAFATTYAETYGYSILEAQSCGCPVISTDIRAIPEINNDESGWIINVPKNDLGNGFLSTPEARQKFSERISKGLYKIIEEILNDKTIIKQKGQSSIQRIKKFHSISKASEVLENLYNDYSR